MAILLNVRGRPTKREAIPNNSTQRSNPRVFSTSIKTLKEESFFSYKEWLILTRAPTLFLLLLKVRRTTK